MSNNSSVLSLVHDIEKKRTIEYYFEDVNPEINKNAYDFITSSLATLDLHYLNDVVFAAFIEMINNAFKANLKRIYFLQNNVSLEDQGAIESLMKNFRENVLDQKNNYLKPMKEARLYCLIRISFPEDDSVLFEIVNNTVMTKRELEKVQARLNNAKEIKNLMEVYDNFSDDSEGAGLGLLMNLMLLKTSGIGPENFTLSSNDKETIARLKVSKTVHRPSYVLDIENRIIDMISELPVFPESIKKIQKLCDDNQKSVSDIAVEIEKDPSLTVTLLKLVKKGGLAKEKEVTNVVSAAGIVGIKGISNMVTGLSLHQIMDSNYKVMEGFWDHSFKAAFYARESVEKLNLDIDPDVAYLAGLLHNIGKIVLASIDPGAIKEINGLIVDENRRTSSVLEEITLGTSHTSIGEKMAMKWGLNEDITSVIRFHHCPFCAPSEHKKLVAVIHVINALLRKEKHKGKMVFLNIGAAEFLNLNNHHNLENFHMDLQEKYTDYLMEEL